MATQVIQTGTNVPSGSTTSESAPNATEQFKDIDGYLSTKTTEVLNKYMPGFASILSSGTGALRSFLSDTLPSLIATERATYTQLRNSGATFLSGQLPADVVAQTRRGAAQRGLEGQQGQNLTARDLGLSSLQLQQQGAQMLSQASATANGMSTLASSGQQQLASFAATGKGVASMFSMSPEILAQLQTSINSTEANKYSADLQYKENMAKIASDTAAAAASRTLAKQQFDASMNYKKQTDLAAIAQSNVNQQLSGVQASLTAKAQAAINPTLIPWASQVTSSVADTNRQLTSFTNNMLSNLGGSQYTSRGMTSNVW